MADDSVCEKDELLARQVGRRDFLALIGVGAASLVTSRLRFLQAAPAVGRPNIIVIVADDLGYADIGVHGCKDIPTPNIDSIAQNGVRFTNAYVSCPVCSPTRAGLMTGRYQQRFGHEFNPGQVTSPSVKFGLPLSQVTLADILKGDGYATGLVGKWHLGQDPEFHPMKRGFDEYFGFLGGSHSYVDAKADPRNLILRGTEPADEKEYLTDAFTREALAFIDRRKAQPFFLYLTYNAVHNPLQATKKYLDRFASIADERRRTYAAMLSAMDDGIGAVLAKLRQSGIHDDTLVFFISDNGGPSFPDRGNASNNLPLRATKGTVYEGGIRVPFLLQWPNRLPRGRAYDNPVISLDILPTAAAAARAQLPAGPAIDGVDLMPYIRGRRSTSPHDILFWRFGQQHAVRKGNWKLVRLAQQPDELYDLASDISESNNLAAAKPDVVQKLSEELAAWESGLSPPLWQPMGPQRNRPRSQARPGRRLAPTGR
jgi:arylsulfatase A-like enzyme